VLCSDISDVPFVATRWLASQDSDLSDAGQPALTMAPYPIGRPNGR
jgi:hypothetical protein